MTTVEIPTSAVAQLAAAPARSPDSWQRAIRNARTAAMRTNAQRWVGFTYTRFVILERPDPLVALRFKCEPDGTVWRIET